HPPRRRHSGHDPPAARRVRARHPRRLRPRHRPPAPRLEDPGLPPRPPPRPPPRRASGRQHPVPRLRAVATRHPRPRARRMDPRQRHLPPLELTMTDDPITAVLQQLADHHDQLTQFTEVITGIGDTLRQHQAALEKLAETPDANPDGYRPYPPPAWWKLAA